MIFYVAHHSYKRWWLHEDYYYINFEDNITGKIRIPDHIVESRDCDFLYRWQHNNVPRNFRGTCPWSEKKEKRKVGIGDTWFEFPREYLILISKHELDGPTDSVLSAFTYPDIKPSFNGGDKEIYFFLEDTKTSKFKNRDAIYLYYRSFLKLVPDYKYDVTFLNYDQDTKMNKYQIDRLTDKNNKKMFSGYLYTNDENPRNPKYFIVCDSEHFKTCNSVMLYKDVSIKYTLPRVLLLYHNDIKQQLLNFMVRYETTSPY